MKTDMQMLRARREEILQIAKHYHAINVRVFGSVARGEAMVSSDVDFLVTFLPGASLLDQAGLTDALNSTLRTSVDVVSEGALNKHLREQVLTESLML